LVASEDPALIQSRSPAAVDLAAEFARLGPWTTQFVINGKAFGGDHVTAHDERVPQFFEAFPDARTILDLGALEGGQAFAMARHGVDRVVAVEGRASNLEKARFMQGVLKVENVEFVLADLERVDLTTLGKFDAVFCCGVLYHLPRPWELIEKLSAISPRLFIWTHYSVESEANLLENGYRGRAYQEKGLQDPWSGLSPTSFWPTLESLQRMLGDAHYSSVRTIKNNLLLPNGPAITLAATNQ
jgi:Methyltransferase domain